MGFVGEGDKSQINFFEIYGNALPDLTVKLQGREIVDFKILENQLFILNSNQQIEIYDNDGK